MLKNNVVIQVFMVSGTLQDRDGGSGLKTLGNHENLNNQNVFERFLVKSDAKPRKTQLLLSISSSLVKNNQENQCVYKHFR